MGFTFVIFLFALAAANDFQCYTCLTTNNGNGKYCKYEGERKCCLEDDQSTICLLGVCVTPYVPQTEFKAGVRTNIEYTSHDEYLNYYVCRAYDPNPCRDVTLEIPMIGYLQPYDVLMNNLTTCFWTVPYSPDTSLSLNITFKVYS